MTSAATDVDAAWAWTQFADDKPTDYSRKMLVVVATEWGRYLAERASAEFLHMQTTRFLAVLMVARWRIDNDPTAGAVAA